MAHTIINKKNGIAAIIWLFLFGFFFGITSNFLPTKTALLIASVDSVSMLIVYYLTVIYIFPRFYGNKRQYIIISSIIITILSALAFVISLYLFPIPDKMAGKQLPFIFFYVRKLMETSFVYFIATSVCLMERNNRLVRNEKILTEQKLETELKLLKAQINPHFIFNALNNIYSLTYTQAQNAPDAVLKLSEMLRYVFYDCSKNHVSLNQEIQYIENFIAFQQMKSEHSQKITLETKLNGNKTELAPMLFIPFIENAFKYSRIEDEEGAFVHIMISSENNKILFFMENSIPPENKPLPGSGTGIKNVQHRLDIVYKNKYELNISETKENYSVYLRIET